MRSRIRRQVGPCRQRDKHNLVSPEPAMFCTSPSHFGCAVQLLEEMGFSYRAGDEEMPKSLLVLTLLKKRCISTALIKQSKTKVWAQ